MELDHIIENLKKEQAAMRKEDALLDAIIKNALYAIVTLDISGKIHSANPAAEVLLGAKESDLLGKDLLALLFKSDETNISADDIKGLCGHNQELILKNVAKGAQSILVSVSAIGNDNEIAYSMILQDLSEQKAQFVKLQERENLLESVIETAADGVIMIDDRGVITTFNKACQHLFGYKKQEVIGQKINMLMPDEHAKNHDGHLQRYHETNERHIVGRGREVPGRRKDGTVFPMYLSVSESSINGRKVFTGIIRDLSQQRDQERMLVEETIKRAKAEEINFNMEQSVNYALRIQKSMLPNYSEIYEQVDSFIYFKPKEVLSGDFYWYMKKGQYLFLAVVDCTGHGVPGAFMSMLGYTHLNYVVNSSRSNDPARILQHMDERIVKALGQRQADNTSTSDDGMDIALARLDLETKELSFSGARRPITILKDGQIVNTKGTKSSIGGHQGVIGTYETHSFQLHVGDSFYLYTDGLTDQFNEAGDKYSSKLFNDFIQSQQQQSMNEMGDRLELDLYRWRGKEHPIDDITVMGVRI